MGWIIFAMQLLGFAYASSVTHLAVLFFVYGIYLGMTEGVEKALITDLSSAEMRGTAFGYFYATMGLAALPASLITGLLWQWYGSKIAFLAGSALAAMGALLLCLVPLGRIASSLRRIAQTNL